MMTKAEKQSLYVRVISAACPGIQIRSARLQTHDGEYNDILVVNGEFIFRFPRVEEILPAFRRETVLLTKIGRLLPLPIPQPIFHSDPAAEFGSVFMGYPLLPGSPLSREVLERPGNETLVQTIAEQLAGFMRALHGLNPAGLKVEVPEMNMPTWARAFFEEVRKNLFFYMREEACKAVADTFQAYFRREDLHRYQPCLIHGDFGGSNILFNEKGISGVLDFHGACVSDPALDLASVSTYGEALTDQICRFYPMDTSMCERAKFYRSLFALEEAMYGWKSGDEDAFSRGMEQYI